MYYISDVHLELYKTDFPVIRGAYTNDILIIAGDLLILRNIDTYKPFLVSLSKKFNKIYWIPGNHEYWGSSNLETFEEIATNIKSWLKTNKLHNIIFDKHIVDHENKLVGCTLWTSLNSGNERVISMASEVMNDYVNMSRTPYDLLEQFKLDYYFLRDNVGEGYTVFTHHAPSYTSVFSTSKEPVRHFYASNLEEFVIKKKPKYWIHGHIHKSQDYLIKNTRVLANPHGYNGIEHNNFDLVLKNVR